MRYTINGQHVRRHEVSERKVRCPNVPNYGCDVRPGYWITYREAYTDGTAGKRVARVLGRIEWAEPVSHETDDVRGYLSVLACSDDLHHAFPRWVNPDDVLTALERPPAAMLAFLSADLPKPDMVHRLSEYGTLSESYVANAAHHIEAFKLGVSPSAYDHGIRSVCPECGRGIKAEEVHACPIFAVIVDGIGEVHTGSSYSRALMTAAEYEKAETPYRIVDQSSGELMRQYPRTQSRGV